jgi:hypothetical protein
MDGARRDARVTRHAQRHGLPGEGRVAAAAEHHALDATLDERFDDGRQRPAEELALRRDDTRDGIDLRPHAADVAPVALGGGPDRQRDGLRQAGRRIPERPLEARRAPRTGRQRRRGAAPPRGLEHVATRGQRGGDAPAEGIAGAGRIDDGGGDRRQAPGPAVGEGHEAAVGGELGHDGGLGRPRHGRSPALGLVRAGELGELLARRAEDVDATRQGQHTGGIADVILVRVEHDARTRAALAHARDEALGRVEAHGGDVDGGGGEPGLGDVVGPQRDLVVALRRRARHEAPAAVGLVEHAAAHGRPGHSDHAAEVDAGVAGSAQRRGRRIVAGARDDADRGRPQPRPEGGVERVAAGHPELDATVGVDDVVEREVAGDDHAGRGGLRAVRRHSGGISL